MNTKKIDTKYSGIFTALCFIIAGIIAIVLGKNQINLELMIIGALVIVFGIAKFFFSDAGIFGFLTMLIPGAVIIALAYFVDGAVLLGAALVIAGLFHLSGTAIRKGNTIRNDKQRLVSLVVALILLILGIAMLVDHGLADTLIVVTGVMLVILGVLELIKPALN